MKTNTKSKRIKNLVEAKALKGKLKQFGSSLQSGALIQGMYTVKDTGTGVWLLDCDARTEQARVQLWMSDFEWYGTRMELKKAIRLL